MDFKNQLIKSNILMKSRSKPKSITSDTRLSNSHVLNRSAVHHIPQSFEPKQTFFSNKIIQSQSKEIQFLRLKNKQLEQRVNRLNEEIRDLQQNRKQLLSLNQQYVHVMNRYYENCNKKIQKRKSCEGKVLEGLERDHRNLVSHCLVMQGEIKNYVRQMQKFQQQKRQLRQANHTSVTEILSQMIDLTNQNKQLKKENNRLAYQLGKCMMENKQMKKINLQMEQQAGNSGGEVEKMKSIMNGLKQETQDKIHAYQSRIYGLQVKIEKLQAQLRKQQECWLRGNRNVKKMQIREVEYIHEKTQLEESLAELLNPQKRKNRMGRAQSIKKPNMKFYQSMVDKSVDFV